MLTCQTKGRKCSYLFTALLLIAMAVELTAAIALKADSQWAENFFLGHTCGVSNSTQTNTTTTCEQQVQDAETFYEDHQDIVFYVILGTLGLQLLAVVFACCYKSTHTRYEELREDDSDDDCDSYKRHRDVESAYGPGRAASTQAAYDNMAKERNSGYTSGGGGRNSGYNSARGGSKPMYNAGSASQSRSQEQAEYLKTKYGLGSPNRNSGYGGSKYGGRNSGYASESSDRGF